MKAAILAGGNLDYVESILPIMSVVFNDVYCISRPNDEQIKEAWEQCDFIWWEWASNGIEKLTAMPKKPIIVIKDYGPIYIEGGYTCVRQMDRYAEGNITNHSMRAQNTIENIDWRKVDMMLFFTFIIRDDFVKAYPNIDCSKDIFFGKGFNYENKKEFPKQACIIGRMSPEKDIDFAIDAFCDPRLKDWQLVIKGFNFINPDRSDAFYQQTILDRCQHFDLPFNKILIEEWGDTKELLRKSSLVLSTSVSETGHLTIMEGMAMGCFGLVRDWAGSDRLYPLSPRIHSSTDLADAILEWDNNSYNQKLKLSKESTKNIRFHPQTGGEDINKAKKIINELVDTEFK